jgi:hypothetical protein
MCDRSVEARIARPPIWRLKISVQAVNIDDAWTFLEGNPVFEAGGAIEIRALPRS